MRKELLEKHRYINVDHDWYVWAEKDFASEMRDNYGVEVKNIQFSGFWSQGDGASFETAWVQIPALLTRLDRAEKCPERTFYEEAPKVKVVRSSSSRCHSNTMVLELDDAVGAFGDSDDAVGAAVWEALDEELRDFFRGKADELYKSLQDEYEYLTSDEVVWDSIEANGLDEDEEEEDV